MSEKQYKTFKEFYPFYLSEHSHPVNRLLHVIGAFIGLVWLGLFIKTLNWYYLPAGFLTGYAFAWVGHFFVEKNTPATFTYPLFSFMGDWVMFFQVITFQRGLSDKKQS
jgi:hypothetical protein